MNTVRERARHKQTNKGASDVIDTDDIEPVATFNYKITKGQVRHVLKLIEQGYSKRAACREVGIARGSFEMAVARIGAADQYARATASLAEEQVQLIENVIDDLRSGQISPEQARIEVEARKWLASKLLPKKFGDKVEHEGNVNVIFSNSIPRPKMIDADATSSVGPQKRLKKG